MTNLEKAKEIIQENIEKAVCGLFFTRNIVGDLMDTLYDDGELQVDICYGWSYFEVFGLNLEEQEELTRFYETIAEY